MPIKVPVAEAKITLLSELSHGRRLLNTGQYRPLIVMGPPTQREAIRERDRYSENYRGVMFVGGPSSMEPGETAEVKMALMFFPDDPYSEVQPGATFTIREGPHIVGFGEVTSRTPESFELPLVDKSAV